MKKKSLLISGLLTLGAAVGVTSYAVTAGLPGISVLAEGDAAADAADADVEVAVPVALTPANDSYALPTYNIEGASMEFASAVTLSTDENLSISLYRDDSTSTVEKLTLVSKWAVTDADHISVDDKTLNIKFDSVLPVGTYRIDVPEGVVTVDGLPNRAYVYNDYSKKWGFTIANPIPPNGGTGDISYPLNGQKLSSTENIQQVWLNFPAGDAGANINRLCKGDVVILKGEETLYIIPATSTDITVDRKWTGRLCINLPKPLEGGVYTVQVPEGLVEVKGLSAAYSWSFTVQEELSYEMSIKAGGGPYSFAQYETITLTWPAGTTLKLNTGAGVESASLSIYNLGKNSLITNYTATVADNVLTLKADDMSGMLVANSATTKYLTLNIPKGLIEVTNGEVNYENSALSITKLLSTAFANSEFKILPDPTTSNLTLADLQEITVQFPESSTFTAAQTANTTVCTLYSGTYTGSAAISNTYSYQYKFKSISEDGHTVVAELAPQGATNSNINNREIFESGAYTVAIPANLVCITGQTANKNGQVNIPAYNMVGGVEYAPIYKSTPADEAGVDNIASLSLNFAKQVNVSDENAEITLSKDGETLVTVKASQTTTANAKAGAAGSTTVAFNNLFKKDGANITEPGIYEFNIPAGAFKQVDGSEYANKATTITVMIGQNIDFTVSPKTATFAGDKNNLEVTPGEEGITEFTTITLTYAEGAKIELLPNWLNAVYAGGAGIMAAQNLLKENNTSTPTVKCNWNKAEIKDNTITFTLNSPYNVATPANYGVCLYIPKGVFKVTIPDGEGAGVYPNANILEYYQGINMYPGLLGTLATTATGAGDVQLMNSDDDENYILAEDLNQIMYKGYESVYPSAKTPKAKLIDADTNEEIVTYSGAEPKSSLMLSQAYVSFTPDDATKLADLPEMGNFKFVIEKGTLQGGSATASSSLVVFNADDFTYEFHTLTTKVNASLEAGSKVKELSTISLSFDNVMMITANPDIKPLVYYKEKITEGIYEGDYKDVDITADGKYTVEIKTAAMPEEELLTLAEGDDEFGVGAATAQVVITPALTDANTYYVHIPAGALLLNTVVKSPSIDLQYVVAPMMAVSDFLKPSMPGNFKFDLTESYGADEDPEAAVGMGILSLSATNGRFVEGSTEKVQLLYGGEVISEIGIMAEDAEVPEGIMYESVNMDDHVIGNFTFMFSYQPDEKFLQAGDYTLVIPDGLFEVAEGETVTAVEGGELKYTMTVPGATVPVFEDFVKMSTPSKNECTLDETYMKMGMAILAFVTAPEVEINEKSTAKIQLLYKELGSTAAPQVVTEVDYESLQFMGVSPFAEDEVSGQVLMLMFEMGNPAYTQPGEYTVVFPEGILTANGKSVPEGRIEYILLPAVQKEYSWAMTPESGTDFTDGISGDIVLTVEGASTVSYDNKTGALYDPENVLVPLKNTYPKEKENTMTWDITAKDGYKWVEGSYTFKIPAMTLCVDGDPDMEPCNFPLTDIVVTYIVKLGATGVAIIGVEGADNYNVYTLDGKVVLLNADADQMINLAPGMYIINGKKAIIRK
ncbi:MAG: hypothetical protein K2H35_05625 [Muribaculaceae bacterium]|nr:hypothetical protein [Muribaculaceae bacterium]